MTSVVAIGGGKGLATTLRALRTWVDWPVAIVSVADDGGSSGRLRKDTDRVAPGDIRKCIEALGDPSETLTEALAFRFRDGDLAGHALGNLLLVGLEEVTGSVQHAITEVGRLAGMQGSVLPATLDHVNLIGETADGTRVIGQVAVMRTHGIQQVWLEPEPVANPQAEAAIHEADLVVLGPGSLYTSVLAASVPAGISKSISEHRHVVYVANVAAQRGETDGYSVADHVDALWRHGVKCHTVVADPRGLPFGPLTVPVFEAPVMASDGLTHDSGELARVLTHLVA